MKLVGTMVGDIMEATKTQLAYLRDKMEDEFKFVQRRADELASTLEDIEELIRKLDDYEVEPR